MYGCFDGVLVYGFFENDRESMLDFAWLREEHPGIEIYAGDVVRHHVGNPVYGVSCEVDSKTGKVTVSNADKNKVKNLRNRLTPETNTSSSSSNNKNKKRKRETKEEEKKEKYGEIGYYLCVTSYDADAREHEKYKLNPANQRVLVEAAVYTDRIQEMQSFGKLMDGLRGGFRF